MENNRHCDKCGGELKSFFGPAKEGNFSYNRLVCQKCGNETMIPEY